MFLQKKPQSNTVSVITVKGCDPRCFSRERHMRYVRTYSRYGLTGKKIEFIRF